MLRQAATKLKLLARNPRFVSSVVQSAIAPTKSMAKQVPSYARAFHTLNANTAPSSNTLSGLAKAGAIITTTLAGYQLYKKINEPRESDIVGQVVDFSAPVPIPPKSTEKKKSAKPRHGSLNAHYKKTPHSLYLQKSAKNKGLLLREVMIGQLLHLIAPNRQPKSMFYEKRLSSEKSQYYSLSEIAPHSVDLEDFLAHEDWKKKLEKKPLLDLDTTLLTYTLIASQQDCKFANIILIEHEDHYEAAVIDHELSGERFFSINHRHLSLNPKHMLTQIKEVGQAVCNSPGEVSSIKEQFSTPHSTAKAFYEYILENKEQYFSKERMLDFTKRASTVSVAPSLQALETFSEQSGLYTEKDIKAWKAEFARIQQTAKTFFDENQFNDSAIEHAIQNNIKQPTAESITTSSALFKSDKRTKSKGELSGDILTLKDAEIVTSLKDATSFNPSETKHVF